jgi:hypothetical protein
MIATVKTETREIEVMVSTTGNIFITITARTSGMAATCAELMPHHAQDLAAFLHASTETAARRRESMARVEG